MSQRDDYGDVPQVLAEPDREVAGGTRGVGETALGRRLFPADVGQGDVEPVQPGQLGAARAHTGDHQRTQPTPDTTREGIYSQSAGQKRKAD